MKIKVLHIITGLGNGGAEKILFDLVRNTSNNKFEHIVVSLLGMGHYGDKLQRAGVKVYCLNLNLANLFVKIFFLLKVINREKPDIVQGWMYHGNIFTLFAKFTKFKTIVWGIHSAIINKKFDSFSTRISSSICAIFSKVPAKIIFVGANPMDNHKLYGYYQLNMVVINNGYDLNLFHPNMLAGHLLREELKITSDKIVVGCVGRFHPVKDHCNLLSAMGYINQKRNDIVVVMVGDGMNLQNEYLINMVQQNNLIENIILAGVRNDMQNVYNAFDFLVLSSKSEAFPNVVAEAMACGKPCVVTDVGDTAYIVGNTGVVVPVEDSIALASGILKMVGYGSSEVKRLGEDAMSRVKQKFSLQNMIISYEELYFAVINKK